MAVSNVLFIYLQLLHEFEKLAGEYQFDRNSDWWKILGDKMNENHKAVEVCIASQLYTVYMLVFDIHVECCLCTNILSLM